MTDHTTEREPYVSISTCTYSLYIIYGGNRGRGKKIGGTNE